MATKKGGAIGGIFATSSNTGDRVGLHVIPIDSSGTINANGARLDAISSVLGTVDDAAITSGSSGTLSGKARGALTISADVWDSGNNRLKVGVMNSPTVSPVAGSTWATRPLQSSAADLQMTATPAAGSTWISAGNVAHDAADSGNPMKLGYKAISHGTNPTAVAANDRTDAYANVAGIPWVIGGHPNIITTEYLWTTAQTDDAVVTISSGTVIVVTQVQVTIDEATTVGVGFRVGFSSATLPTAPTDGTAVVGYLASHRGLVPGSGLSRGDGSGILGIGADDQDVRITAEAPTSGSASLVLSYYTLPS